MRSWRRIIHHHWCDSRSNQALAEWYRGVLGQRLQQSEQALLETVLADLFGYHLIWLNSPWDVQPLESCRIRHQLGLGAGRQVAGNLVAGREDALPIQTDSVDVMVLPHVLEFADNPHQILREVDRCLIPEGHVVILGFKPFGLWGLRHLLSGWRRQPPWCGHFYSAGRLRDWFSLLGFETLKVLPVVVNPPLAHPGLLKYSEWLNRLGRQGWPVPAASYLYIARKRVIGMTPLRPRWRPRRGILSPGVVEPSQRQGSR